MNGERRSYMIQKTIDLSLRRVVKAALFTFAISGLAILMLHSFKVDYLLSEETHFVLETWSVLNTRMWSVLTDWSGLRIRSVFRTALWILIFCTCLYLSIKKDDAHEGQWEDRSRIDTLSFSIAFSVIITLIYNSILFPSHGNFVQIASRLVGIFVAGLSMAIALPERAHLTHMAKGLWFSIGIVLLTLGVNYLMFMY